MAAKSVFMAQIDARLQADDNELSRNDRYLMLKQAIDRYSHDQPDEITADITGDGGRYYAISLLTSWQDEYSEIRSIEYPAATIANDETAVYLDSDDYDADYYDGAARYIYFPNHSIGASEAFRVRYTAPYTETADTWNTPAGDFFAIADLAAALCCQAIATKYSRTNDTTINADAADHDGRAGRFADRYTELMASYEKHMGIGAEDDKPRPMAAFITIDIPPAQSKKYLSH